MLTPRPPKQPADLAALEAQVLDIVIETTGVARDEMSAGTALIAALDSLTLAAVVARAEAALGFELAGNRAVEVLAARDVGELCRLIAEAASRSRANLHKQPRNGGCDEAGSALE